MYPGLSSHCLTAARSLGRIQLSMSRDRNLFTVGSPRGWNETVEATSCLTYLELSLTWNLHILPTG